MIESVFVQSDTFLLMDEQIHPQWRKSKVWARDSVSYDQVYIIIKLRQNLNLFIKYL